MGKYRTANDHGILSIVTGLARLIKRTLLCSAICTAIVVGAENIFSQDLARIQSDLASANRENKVEALVQIRSANRPEASRLALPSFSDRDPVIRAMALASAAAALPAEEFIAAAVPLLRDKEELVRRDAAYALGDPRFRSAEPQLLTALKNDKSLMVKAAAAVSLGKIGSPSAVSPLLRVLSGKANDDNEFVRRSAARAIGQIAETVRGAEIQKATPRDLLPARYKDGSLGSVAPAPGKDLQDAVGVLLRIAQSSKEAEDTRREAAFALGSIGDKRALPFLNTALTSGDIYMAEISREAILKIPVR